MTVFAIDDLKVRTTRHAVQRYWERVRPGLPTIDAATKDLLGMIERCGQLGPAPPWARQNIYSHILIGDDVALPVVPSEFGGLVIATCQTRGGEPDETRERRNARRAKTRNRRATRRKTQRFTDGKHRRQAVLASERTLDVYEGWR